MVESMSVVCLEAINLKFCQWKQSLNGGVVNLAPKVLVTFSQNVTPRGCGEMVSQDFAKVQSRVRFPLPAPNCIVLVRR